MALSTLKSIKFSTLCKSFYFLAAIILLSSCGKKKIEIDGFDPIAWQQNRMVDAENCITYREKNYRKLLDDQKFWVGKEDGELREFLGTEDKLIPGNRLKDSKAYCIKGCEMCDSSEFTKYLVFDFETFKRIKTIRIAIEHKEK
jgi:hypothetical protein